MNKLQVFYKPLISGLMTIKLNHHFINEVIYNRLILWIHNLIYKHRINNMATIVILFIHNNVVISYVL
jgi:hypothetical protein